MKANFKILDENVWMLEGVRLSYPNLWKPGMYEGALKSNLDSSYLLDPKQDKDVIKAIMQAFVKAAKTQNPKISKISQIKDPKLVKSDDVWVVKTSNTLNYPPIYFGFDGRPVADPLAEGADRVLYAGCYVRIKLSVNPVTLDSGKVKVWCNLTAIQFLEHGEKLGGGLSNDEIAEGFEEVETEFEKSSENKPSDDDDFDDDDFDDDDDDFDLD